MRLGWELILIKGLVLAQGAKRCPILVPPNNAETRSVLYLNWERIINIVLDVPLNLMVLRFVKFFVMKDILFHNRPSLSLAA